MRKGKFAVSAIFLFGIVTTLYSTPTWMWIGTYYMTSSETSCCDALDGASHATSFWDGAVNNHYNGPTPYRYVNAPGKQMNIANLDENSSSREMNDFIFLMAHGRAMHDLNIWNADGTDCTAYNTNQWLYGSDYTRWVYFQSCGVLSFVDLTDHYWWDAWDLAFRGAQACLGYCSTIYDMEYFVNCAGEFWNNWADSSNQMSIWNAHRQAAYDEVYSHGWDCTPAILSCTSPSNSSHIYWDDTYNDATSESGNHYAVGIYWVEYN